MLRSIASTVEMMRDRMATKEELDHVESESVLHRQVKDRPDMLRLLGQAPPPGG